MPLQQLPTLTKKISAELSDKNKPVQRKSNLKLHCAPMLAWCCPLNQGWDVQCPALVRCSHPHLLPHVLVFPKALL